MSKLKCMPPLLALSTSIAVLGGVWAYLALGPLAGSVLVWAGFIAWGCYFHNGGDNAAITTTVAGTAFGAVLAGVALYLVGANPLGLSGAAGPAVYIAVTVFFLVFLSSISVLSAVPANVYGYAATAGYALHEASAGSVTATDLSNPVLLIIVSAIAGTIFGVVSGKLAGALTK